MAESPGIDGCSGVKVIKDSCVVCRLLILLFNTLFNQQGHHEYIFGKRRAEAKTSGKRTGITTMARFEFSSSDQISGGANASGDILFQLGVMYATGREVQMNLVEAHKWFNIAATRGSG